jgi:hypothetical protein
MYYSLRMGEFEAALALARHEELTDVVAMLLYRFRDEGYAMRWW